MKILVCSVPKSGTYLLANFLSELGFTNSSYHLNDNEYSDYSTADLPSARRYPGQFRKQLDFSEVITSMEDNQFAVGHFSTHNKSFINTEFKIIFLYRNLRECTVSFCRWTNITGRWREVETNSEWRERDSEQEQMIGFLEQHGERLKRLFSQTVPWRWQSDVFHVDFNSLIGEKGREVQVFTFERLCEYLNCYKDKRSLEAKISNALNKESLTKSHSSYSKEEFWSNTANRMFKEQGFKYLNSQLGFENNKGINRLAKIFFDIGKKPLSFYDKYWLNNKGGKRDWNYGINVVSKLIENYNFRSVLDAGCGSGDVVRYLLDCGYEAKGIELSKTALQKYAKDLYRKGKVRVGTLTSLPYSDNEFDVVFSSEVLEHISESDIDRVVEELHRVTSKVLFMTISLRPSSNFNRYHITLKPRSWWEEKFINKGFTKEEEMVNKLQQVILGGTKTEVLQVGPTKTHIHEMEWFIEGNNYSLQGECEPWYFIFRKG